MLLHAPFVNAPRLRVPVTSRPVRRCAPVLHALVVRSPSRACAVAGSRGACKRTFLSISARYNLTFVPSMMYSYVLQLHQLVPLEASLGS